MNTVYFGKTRTWSHWFFKERGGTKIVRKDEVCGGRQGGMGQAELRRPEGAEIKQALRVLNTP